MTVRMTEAETEATVLKDFDLVEQVSWWYHRALDMTETTEGHVLAMNLHGVHWHELMRRLAGR